MVISSHRVGQKREKEECAYERNGPHEDGQVPRCMHHAFASLHVRFLGFDIRLCPNERKVFKYAFEERLLLHPR